MPWAGTLLLPFQVPAWQQGSQESGTCSPSALLALEFESLHIPRAARQVREEELLLPGAICTSTAPLCPQDQFLPCAFQQQAGSCLPCQPLPASPVFLGASLLPHGSVSLSNNPNVDPLSSNPNVDRFSQAITQMGLLSLSSHPRVTVQVAPHSRAVPPRLCSEPVLLLLLLLLLPFSLLQHSSCAAALASSSPSPCEDTIKGLRFHPCSLLPLSGCGTGATGVGDMGSCQPSAAAAGTGSTSCSTTALSMGSPFLPPARWDPSGQHKESRHQGNPGREWCRGSTRALSLSRHRPCPGLGSSRAPALGQSS
ncbi:PREDICTED: uncharacterized protein LOC107603862 isoform X1 [Ficedula albicollis]|uniref:uncharacterized protein LOC107603862 isoform X1 n=1 Tax=Ficedula albicollis TaxID=59894 RepID=UPI0007AD7C1C|nr:PREDICTED: uncharacterized protein LOC107603862 isoform X1 [Ficedula albicollis]